MPIAAADPVDLFGPERRLVELDGRAAAPHAQLREDAGLRPVTPSPAAVIAADLGTEAPLALGAVLLVLLMLAANLEHDVDDDHVDDDADAAEGDDQSKRIEKALLTASTVPLGRGGGTTAREIIASRSLPLRSRPERCRSG